VKKRAKNSIVTIDLYNDKFYKFVNGKFEAIKKLKFSNKDILVSYLANSELIIEPMSFSPNLSKEDIIDVAHNRAYEELKLDTATKYNITPIQTAIKGAQHKYQTIIVDQNRVKKRFNQIASKRDVIDYIIPAPLLYKILYYSNRLDGKNCDIFLHFGVEDTFVTFYYKGEFLYSKSIKYSLTYMYERVCQLAQEVFLTKEQFFDLLKQDGLKKSEGRTQELLIQVFNECFLNLNDVLIYTKRVYDINNINKVYVGFSCGYLTGIDAYVKNYLNLETAPITSIYSKADPAKSVDSLSSLMLMSALEAKKGLYNPINITPYPKPAPLNKRPAGKLIFGSALVAGLFLLPVAYDYFGGLAYQIENSTLVSQEAELNAIATRYKTKLKAKREELKALEEANNKLAKLYNRKRGELDEVYNKKFHYQLKSEQLALVTEVLTNYDIKSKNITVNDGEYLIELEAKDDNEITAFIKKLVSKFEKKIVNVDIDNIKFDKNDKLYKGVLKVEFTRGG
jgi:hypothetical protein